MYRFNGPGSGCVNSVRLRGVAESVFGTKRRIYVVAESEVMQRKLVSLAW